MEGNRNGGLLQSLLFSGGGSGSGGGDNRFVVTLTPTAQDFSGVMDKTVAEITEAYQANKRIFFRVMVGSNSYENVECNSIIVSDGFYPSFRCFIIKSNMLIFAFTSTGIIDGTINTYSTTIYPLASGQ